MADKKIKRKETETKPQPTVQHESSANSAQELGIRENVQLDQRANHRKRRNSGSDGADQERGSNH